MGQEGQSFDGRFQMGQFPFGIDALVEAGRLTDFAEHIRASRRREVLRGADAMDLFETRDGAILAFDDRLLRRDGHPRSFAGELERISFALAAERDFVVAIPASSRQAAEKKLPLKLSAPQRNDLQAEMRIADPPEVFPLQSEVVIDPRQIGGDDFLFLLLLLSSFPC